MERRKMKGITIAVDFDGTCVTHDYPRVGRPIGSVPILKKLVESGHQLILFTMRDKEQLNDAVNWFSDNEIPLYGIQSNPDQKRWTSSPKAYGNLYIDDAALGCPLMWNEKISERAFVDWVSAEEMLSELGLFD